MKIRIHHFFDIIRDFGTGKEFTQHPYLHSYHIVAGEIDRNPNLDLEIVFEPDAVCTGCAYLKNTGCADSISHRKDFSQKDAFNNYLDYRIVEICKIQTSVKFSPKTLCQIAHKYINHIEFIYEGNDQNHTQMRKENLIKGLIYYSEKFGFAVKIPNN